MSLENTKTKEGKEHRSKDVSHSEMNALQELCLGLNS